MPSMLWQYLLLTTLFWTASVRAQGWEDFADNFATDLAPLVALFGERLTKQFLAESTSRLDNLIFALCPLGILTAVVSVIRICGNSSLRAFVGRANEAPGEAENELLSCVSEGTAELFNDGGISRVFGRPRILEVVVWEEQGSYELGTLRDALEVGAWSTQGEVVQTEKGLLSLPELDIPNLSLNKGIERRGPGWFYAAALLGVILQGGTLVYAGLTVFWYSGIFGNDDGSSESYALPFYLYGSISLSVGMFLCAFLIERSSSESYLQSEKPSKLYWLQPGRQKIGEQDFGAFLAVDESPGSSTSKKPKYIKSVRGPPPRGKRALLVFTICVTMVGFVLQFVGLRGLHPSVIIADVGSTLLMAVVRTCLRTKRIGSDGNQFRKDDRELFSHNQQELDCFAYHLEKVKSFHLMSSPVHQSVRSRSGSCTTSQSSQISNRPSGLGAKLIRTRAKLAELTSCDRHPSMNWDDLPIRKVAQDLARTIEMTMEVVSGWKEVPSSTSSFELTFACHPDDDKSRGSLETYPIMLERSNDTFQWKVDSYELEAILGLWTFSLLKSDPGWLQHGLGRAVGLTKEEAKSPSTDLYFHKWIFRQREAIMVSHKMISFPEQNFGYFTGNDLDNKEILVVKTDNNLGVMAAQDVYIQFIMCILRGVKCLGGNVDIFPVSQNSFIAQSTSLDELVACFESGNLGSREDALLCIVPALNHLDILPELAGDTSTVRERVQKLTSDGNWDGAFSILQWLSRRSEGNEYERSVYELGLLCQRAMLTSTAGVRDTGFEIAKFLLQCDIRANFFEGLRNLRPSSWMNSHEPREWWTKFSSQLGWATWHIANRLNRQVIMDHIESIGLLNNPILETKTTCLNSTRPDVAQLMVLASLDPEFVVELQGDYQNGDDLYMAESLYWVNSNEQAALRYWLLARWAEYGKQFPHQAMKAFVRAAQSSKLAVATLCRQGADINAVGNERCTALMELVSTADKEGTRTLLEHGADVNACSTTNKLSSLGFAAIQGHADILYLLLDHGADLELRNLFGHTALQSACTENHLACATLLLERGANIESIATDGRTPLLLATVGGYLDIVKLLIERGANINATDSQGSTALMLAVTIQSEELVSFLLSMRADKNKGDDVGRTALAMAYERGYTSISAILEAA
ncbi:ankyrin repeat domain-containing protein [Aspergillus mulundensis]|uniref:Uncharacterized protein n=1 Tax=Aspergillus mulundensis TaxID=1810919 RepID=A0A3D8SK50_9EURO|nr:Uncharacterized protein DSM5745_03361 [Aspergillus mulundensis]RDW86719.1 Uncharacterized protein DSM5745_03361 [Aspergillus mulundensis]